MANMQYHNALIVGAGSGLSASLARLFSRNGVTVTLAPPSTEKLQALATETHSAVFTCDATRQADVENLFASLERQHGAPDVVVYNASFRTRGALADLVPADVE